MALAFGVAYLSVGTVAQAQQAEQTGQAFTISPPLLELSADPGDTVSATLKFTNVSQGNLSVTTEYNDFGAKNETGEPNIIFDTEEGSPESLRNWIAAQGDFNVAAGETIEVTFPIRVPADAEPGGHYAVIRFTGTASGTDGNEVALSASIGTLVLLTVSGDIREEAGLEELYAAAPDFSRATLFENGPINIVERIRNTGNLHIRPTGELTVKDMFGNVVSTSRVNGSPDEEKNKPKSVLPGSVRRFDQKIDINNGWMFGKYDATVTLSYGTDASKTLTGTTSFWVIPYRLITIGLFAAVALFFLSRFMLQRYNERIIKKAASNNKKH